ncbi:MAG: hypothetical protein ACI8SR_003267, partial [Oceanicoccus sp.]
TTILKPWEGNQGVIEILSGIRLQYFSVLVGWIWRSTK